MKPLTVRNSSDAKLQHAATRNPAKLEYLSSAGLPLSSTQSQAASAPQSQVPSGRAGEARVHVTSSPSGGEIYVDGEFFGNTPSDITLPTAEHGEHVVKITVGDSDWTSILALVRDGLAGS